uniref:Uncharacterized protein n=1 Tax=Rhizophora mucronata TaxID=61149 RepID=A0A2P2JLM4_RHIMU
MAAKTKAKQPR